MKYYLSRFNGSDFNFKGYKKTTTPYNNIGYWRDNSYLASAIKSEMVIVFYII